MARTIRTKVFKFDELSESAKQNAIDEIRQRNWNYESPSIDEIRESYKAANEIYVQLSNIDEVIKGKRLYAWVQNNLSPIWTRRNHISKHKDGTFKNSDFQYKYDCLKHKVSKVFVTNNLENCPLTGVCFDFDFLQPIIDYLKKPNLNWDNIDLANEMPSFESIAEREREYEESDEYITEEILANEYEFTKDGKQFY